MPYHFHLRLSDDTGRVLDSITSAALSQQAARELYDDCADQIQIDASFGDEEVR